MAKQDRRSGKERRGTKRFQIEVEAEWETSKGRYSGALSDVNLDGCFVLSSGDVNDGENVKIYVRLADGITVEFDGRVANHVFEIGFGVKFDELSAVQRDMLFKIVRDFERA